MLRPCTFSAWRRGGEAAQRDGEPEYVLDRVGLILPTSLCSGQVALHIAQRLNEKLAGRGTHGVTRFVALPHTEGCGCSGGINEEVYAQTLLGYLVHPSVHSALLLEHGCEKTHNHAMMEKLQRMHIPVDSFGWASVQLDGGIEKAKQRVEEYFVAALQLQGDSFPDAPLPSKHEVDLSHLRVGLLTVPTRAGIPPAVAKTFAAVSQAIASHGGVVVVPSNQGLLSDNAFVNAIVDTQILGPSLLYGQTFKGKPGHFHVMQNSTAHWVETVTGLGATGVELLVAFVPATSRPQQVNPLVPLLQVTYVESPSAEADGVGHRADFDLCLEAGASVAEHAQQLLGLMAAGASRAYTPKLFLQGNVDFQLTRGDLGVSL